MRLRMIPIKFRGGAQLNCRDAGNCPNGLRPAIDMFNNREKFAWPPRRVMAWPPIDCKVRLRAECNTVIEWR
jgi:hypothetical protein